MSVGSGSSNDLITQGLATARNNKHRVVRHMRAYGSSGAKRWVAPKRIATSNDDGAMQVLVEYDRSYGFPVYRFAFQAETFPVSELAVFGPYVRVRIGRSFKEPKLDAPMPSVASLNASDIVQTPWVFCPVCLDEKIDESNEGLRLAAQKRRLIGRMKSGPALEIQAYIGTVVGLKRLPDTLVSGPKAFEAAASYGAKLDRFEGQRENAKPANEAYAEFVSDYRERLPQTAMQRGTCETTRSASAGDIADLQRSARINRAAETCRKAVLAGFNRAFYKANLPTVQRKEARLFAQTVGVERATILSTEEVVAQAEKLVSDAQLLAEGFRSDVSEQASINEQARARSRRERAARDAIFQNAAETNRLRQQQERDVGTQQIDPVTGRVTTASQREAEAARLGQNAGANRESQGNGGGSSNSQDQSSNASANRETPENRAQYLTFACKAEAEARDQCWRENRPLSYEERQKLTKAGIDWRERDRDFVCAPLHTGYESCLKEANRGKVDVGPQQARGK